MKGGLAIATTFPERLSWTPYNGNRNRLWLLSDGRQTWAWVRAKVDLEIYEAMRFGQQIELRGAELQRYLLEDGLLIGIFGSLQSAKAACRDIVMGVNPDGV